MRALVQRVSEAGVVIKSENYSAEIKHGMVILLGVTHTDTEQEVIFTADKCAGLRIFEDDMGKMNLSIKDVDGEILVISQFTLYGDARKGNRPNFTSAARPELAENLYNMFINRIKENLGAEKVRTGIFGAMMDVRLINSGPVTIMVESK